MLTVGAIGSRAGGAGGPAAAVPGGAAGGIAEVGGQTRRVTPAREGPRARRRTRELLAGAGAGTAGGRRQVRGAPGEFCGTPAPAGPQEAETASGAGEERAVV